MELIQLNVSRNFIKKYRDILNSDEGLKCILPNTIEEDYKNFFQIPGEFLNDTEFTQNCLRLAESGAKKEKNKLTKEKTR